jgi:phosphinothricin acetyltransferase
MRIRIATPADAEAVRVIYAPYVEATAISFEVDMPSTAEMAARITARYPAYPWLVAEGGDGGVAGYAYASRFAPRAAYAWSVETSVYLAGAARRQGIGRALYTALLTILSAQGYRRAFAGTTLPNAASIGFHEAMEFAPAGVYRDVGWKLGAWHDVSWLQLSLGSSDGDPQPPLPYTDLPAGTVAAALAAGTAMLGSR